MSRRRGALTCGALGCAAAGLVLLLVAAIGLTRQPDATNGAVALPAASGRLPAAAPAASAEPTVPPPGRAARLLLPRLHVSAPVVGVDLDGRVMRVPRDPHRVGWWVGGALPGADRGSAVLVGHVNYAGVRGAFAALPRLRPGDGVRLTDPDVTFRVSAVRSYPKSTGLPAAIFSRTGPAQLVLITCGGSFDRASGNYRDNVVVYARRV